MKVNHSRKYLSLYDEIGIRTQMFFYEKIKKNSIINKIFGVVTKNDEHAHSLSLIHPAQVLNKMNVSHCALKCENQSNRREIRESKKPPQSHPRQERVSVDILMDSQCSSYIISH